MTASQPTSTPPNPPNPSNPPIPSSSPTTDPSTAPAFRRARTWCAALGALALAAVLAGCGGGGSSHSSTALRGDVLDPPVALPASAGPLQTTTGQTMNLGSLPSGKLMLVYFGYTHCPDVCPTTMADIGEALRQSSPQVRDATRVVFITADPARDTVPVLKQWLANFDSGLPHAFVGVTGNVATIDAAAKKVGVPLEPPVKQKNGTYTVDHGAQVLAFQNGHARVLWLAGTPVGDLQHDFAQLVSAPVPTSSGSARALEGSAVVGDLQITGAYVPQPASPDVAAAYLTVRNNGDAPDALIGASSPDAQSVTMHNTVRTSSGIEQMVELSQVPVPAHGSVVLKVGQRHLMIMSLQEKLVAGDRLPLLLTFRNAGTVGISVPVTPIGGSGAQDSTMSGMK